VGWSIGFLGGLVSLGASLAYISWAEGRGQGAAEFVPVSMLITAGLFALSALPTFLILRERAVPQPHRAGRGVVRSPWRGSATPCIMRAATATWRASCCA